HAAHGLGRGVRRRERLAGEGRDPLAVEHRHFVTDIHATILQLLGLDSRRLEIPGRQRLAIDHGVPIREIMA
ncbi:MAG: DUF1501 domain-containing protein, partial [Gemmataceae bacterium]|nr:DUF1501 domain-containing protein [Gemmataceae bacterium]